MSLKNNQTQIEGTLVQSEVITTTSKAGKDFKRHQLVIETGKDKDDLYMIECKPNSELITARVGDKVQAVAWVNCRMWNDKYFYSLHLAAMTVLEACLNAVSGEQIAEEISQEASAAMEQEEGSGLPF
jgi:hypothetical protein